jgi:lysozyme
MNDKEIMDQIKRHEGYRETVYFDSVGVPTVGYGHALLPGSRIPAVVADILFEQDYNDASKDYTLLALRWGFNDINTVRRGIIINMLFNMGMARVTKFQRMLTALQMGKYDKAADEMLDSRWAKQVGKRADELADLMRKGE